MYRERQEGFSSSKETTETWENYDHTRIYKLTGTATLPQTDRTGLTEKVNTGAKQYAGVNISKGNIKDSRP